MDMLEIEEPKRRLRDSMGFRMAVIGGLVILLLIPLGMVRSLIEEREHWRKGAAEDVAATWGKSQLLGGPVLTVPYQQHLKGGDGKDYVSVCYARFLPADLRIDGKVAPERRNRGIFEAVVYRADLRWSGSFQRPSFAAWKIAPEDVLWNNAYLSVGVPDLRGIRSAVALHWNRRALQFQPGGEEEGLWSTGLRVPLPDLAAGQEGDSYGFAFDLGLNGSSQLQFLPLGQQTTVSLSSSWPSPSFNGAVLPDSHHVTATGFDATWSRSWFNRGYPQQWRREDAGKLAPKSTLEASAFGVALFLSVDSYQKTERSAKYGALFLVLTFLTFFLYEVFSGVPLHPMQYFLVGSALCLFYLLLLSISEHSSFGLAYLVASVATVLLIGGYSAAVLHGRTRALLMAVVLGVLYGYLYVLLQLEDYALLLGSVGLFLILALVMFLTRKIDWGNSRPADVKEIVTPG